MKLLLFLVFSSLPIFTYANIEIVHFNIGQGDSTLIISKLSNGEHKAILIDAGYIKSPDAGQVITKLLDGKGIAEIDVAIVTHYDADHFGGLVTKPIDKPRNHWGTRIQDGVDKKPNTNDDINIAMLVDRGSYSTNSLKSTSYKEYLRYAKNHPNRKSIKNSTDIKNFQINLGDGAYLQALSANGYVIGHNGKIADVNTENELSLSFLLRYKEFSYYVGGDVTGRLSGGEDAEIEAQIGSYLESKGIELDVIQVNHHGANNGSDDKFLADTKPKVAIISAGTGNSHEHPDYDALLRLAKNSSIQEIYMTEFGNTVWDDKFLKKKALTKEEKERKKEIFLIRSKLQTHKANLFLTTDGRNFDIYSEAKIFKASD